MQRPASATVERPLPSAPVRKNPTLKAKASGFFAKRKPQLNVDTSPGVVRKFSFEAGDDANATLSATPIDNLPASVRERLIRKSASMSFLELTHSKAPSQEPQLPPVVQSPTNSTPLQVWNSTSPDYDDSRKPSRIPTPVYRRSSLARPRQEREDSASSLLTAIRHSGAGSRRSGSSSSYSSPSASRTDLTQGLHRPDSTQGSCLRGAGSNRLLDHTNALRGNAVAISAAKAASTSTTSVDQEMEIIQAQRPSPQNSNNSRPSTLPRTNSDLAEPRKENCRPMGKFPKHW